MTDLEVRRLCATHKGPKAAAARDGYETCDRCYEWLTDTLRDVPRLWDELLEVAEAGGRVGGDGGGNSESSHAPTRLDVLAMSDPRSRAGAGVVPVARWWLGWAHRVAGERRASTRPANLYEAMRVLASNVEYIARQGYVAELAGEVRQVHYELRRLCGELRPVIDRCQAPSGEDPDVECGGPLFQHRDGSATVVCGRCGDTFSDGAVFQTFGELRRLGLILESGERGSGDVEAVAGNE